MPEERSDNLGSANYRPFEAGSFAVRRMHSLAMSVSKRQHA